MHRLAPGVCHPLRDGTLVIGVSTPRKDPEASRIVMIVGGLGLCKRVQKEVLHGLPVFGAHECTKNVEMNECRWA